MADWSEVEKLAVQFDQSRRRVGAEGSAAIRRAARVVKRQQEATAPVGKTGNLRNSITIEYQGTGNSARSMSATVGPTEYYGRFQEWGTAFQDPQPFVGPSGPVGQRALVKDLEAREWL